MDTLTKLNTVMDEYVAEYVERHGTSAASYSEAHAIKWELHDAAVYLTADQCDDLLDDEEYSLAERAVISAAWDHAQKGST